MVRGLEWIKFWKFDKRNGTGTPPNVTWTWYHFNFNGWSWFIEVWRPFQRWLWKKQSPMGAGAQFTMSWILPHCCANANWYLVCIQRAYCVTGACWIEKVMPIRVERRNTFVTGQTATCFQNIAMVWAETTDRWTHYQPTHVIPLVQALHERKFSMPQ